MLEICSASQKLRRQISTAAVTVALLYLPPVAQSDGADLNRRLQQAVQKMKKASPKQKAPCWVLFIWRWHPDLNRGITVLQTVALPLGYVTLFFRFFTFSLFPLYGLTEYFMIFFSIISFADLYFSVKSYLIKSFLKKHS